jgi:hypothetical protein
LRSAGSSRTVVTQTFTVDVSDGHLMLDFNSVQGEALVSTISIVPRETRDRDTARRRNL